MSAPADRQAALAAALRANLRRRKATRPAAPPVPLDNPPASAPPAPDLEQG